MNKAIRLSSEEAIMESAITLMSRNPGVTMSEIAINAGVGRATLHRHFSSRDALIHRIQLRSIEETNHAVAQAVDPHSTALERLLAMFTAVIPLGDRYHFLSREPSQDKSLRQQYKAQLAWLTALVDELRRDNVVSTAIPSSWIVAQIDQLIWTAWCEVSAGRLAAQEAPQLAMRTLVNGLGD